jgi:hypothetical protein
VEETLVILSDRFHNFAEINGFLASNEEKNIVSQFVAWLLALRIVDFDEDKMSRNLTQKMNEFETFVETDLSTKRNNPLAVLT